MKIRVILPTIMDTFNQEVQQEFAQYVGKQVEVDVCHLDYGPASVEGEYDEALCIPNLLEKAIAAEQEGCSGVISLCFADPGVKAAREVVSIPVVGAGESSMLIASMLGKSFSVVTVLPHVIHMIENVSKTTGVNSKLASVRYVDIPVLDLVDKAKMEDALFAEMVRAIEDDKAHGLVLGCTGMLGVAASLQERLKQHGYEVPVIDPSFASAKMLESLIAMGVKQSRLTYMPPRQKWRK
ncbi:MULTISPECIES: aspartate/glutamate racemase family protein [Brevibacillus]|uniref:aspartate/glutamate racemase family protein n=1 Tax=Brevibacillus TaxID=55080 RepID=UPI000ECDCBBB|nr:MULTISPECIES: aspartate/glutamate racemase family protein [Brevibacillus]MDH6350774.1 allantoin racemase [Brevibacillus sp. 1238]MDR4998178.1 aspartate/glutamate racemase family protein [Brevibacillus parabrevis]HBZ79145.1 hydrogenase expression protein HupH [Brevibacillus sp.]